MPGIMRGIWFAILIITWNCAVFGASQLRLATFRCEVTPALGEPLIWVTPATKVEGPLWAKGVVLDDGRARYVLCAVDWCGIGGAAYELFREKIAAAAGIGPEHVALQSVHQHTAPYVDGDAYRLLSSLGISALQMSDGSLQAISDRIARSVAEACTHLVPFDRIGAGKARVERVASARRVFQDGRLITRFSSGETKPKVAALSEGSIDPILETITLAAGNKPLVRLHYYATHPQTFCCDGRVSGDFVSAARETIEKEEGVFQIYFTGCAGDITVGKYNDTSVEARADLANRLGSGMREAIAATRFYEAINMYWRIQKLRLPLKTTGDGSSSFLYSRLAGRVYISPEDAYRTAISLAFARRSRPLFASALEIGGIRILHLPGEPMLEFQSFARQESGDKFIAISGYGDMSPGYLCTDRAFKEGGYEPSASNSGPGTESRVKLLIRELLR
ncbi:MAG TPA: hypothetical protein VE398_10295 [Acidobacteriota bacterium]|nr:hypothetical protein [Acidobacteriota bacterium]